MKTHYYILILLILVAQISFAQLNKQIATNPYNPIDNDFISMYKSWYPTTNYNVNPFLNNYFNWYLTKRQIEELTLRVIDLQEQINKIKE